MGLRILHTADWHMDSPFGLFSPERRAWLEEQQCRLPGKIAQLARREHCDLVLISGDIFDSPTSRERAPLVREALAACGVPVLIAPGNHDYLTTGSPWLEEAWPENVYIFPAGLSDLALPQLDCRIYGAGYRAAECPGLLENFRAEGNEKFHIGVLHADPMRLRSPYCPVTAAQVRDSGLDYLALGHIHKAGSFRAGDTLCGWPGTPMGRGYDETGEKGAYIVELGERTELRFVPLDTPRFFDLEADMDTQSLEAVLPPAENAHFYRVTLTGSGGESPDRMLTRFAHLPNLEMIDRREKQMDLWENAGEDSLEGVYFRLLRQKLEAAEGDQAEMVAMAAEISRRILGGREVAL